MNNFLLTFKLDTGAECNVLPYIGKKTPLLKSNCRVVTYSGHTMETKGKAILGLRTQ